MTSAAGGRHAYDFQPQSFLDTAERLLRDHPTTEADHRTIIGRAYYAAYGTVRVRLCRSRGISPERLFGKFGRHSVLEEMIREEDKVLFQVSEMYSKLYNWRIMCDYAYSTHLSRTDAEGAVDSARVVVKVINNVDAETFRKLPLRPARSRRGA